MAALNMHTKPEAAGIMQSTSPHTIRHVVATDEIQWDKYVSQHSLATPYHRFAWQLATEKAYGHEIASAIAFNENDEVVGVFPAILMAIPIAGKQLCALPYCDLGYGLADSTDILQAMQQHLLAFSSKNHCKFLEVRGVIELPQDESQLVHQKVRMLLPLETSAESQLASFKSKLRSQIRKAEKNGLTFKTGYNSTQLSHFYDVYSRNMRDLGSPVHHINWFKHILNLYGEHAVLSVVYKDEVPAGAGIVLKNGQHACIPWASTLREFNPLAPNMLLYWSLLSHCADNNITLFDFGRSTYEEGTYRFKKQWGAQPQLLSWQKLDAQASPIPQQQSSGQTGKLRGLIENTWRKLPLGLTIKAGALIRPYISL